MGKTCILTLRVPTELAENVDTEASRLGITVTDFMAYAARCVLGEPPDPAIRFLMELSKWIEATFDKQAFPSDVTLRVFHHIRDTEEFRGQYNVLIKNEHGARDPSAVTSLHRRIGRLVKRVLNAEVIARSVPLNPDEHLVTTHALLVPHGSTSILPTPQGDET